MEKIYTIPVNEAFDASAADPAKGCPLCALHRMLEENELESILGASMMEPDIRQKTNELGFCHEHYEKMVVRKNRLGLALILESHLDEWRDKLRTEGLFKPSADKRIAAVGQLSDHCYVCEKANFHFDKMKETAVLLWDSEKGFRDKFDRQPYFCLEHYAALCEYAKKRLPKKRFAEFSDAIDRVTFTYYDKLREDVKWFIKKFDYRYEEEPWYDAKDAVERAIRFLSGEK